MRCYMPQNDTLVTELRALLMRHEGLKLKPYRCTAGKLTIGVGRNLEDVGISEDEALYLLVNDTQRVTSELQDRIPFWNNLSLNKQVVIASMAFQLGVSGLMAFKKMLAAAEDGDDEEVVNQMRDSVWYSQTPKRVEELIERWKG
jgi:lysozyme